MSKADRAVQHIRERLASEEVLAAYITCRHKESNVSGVLAVTASRFLFYGKAFMSGEQSLELAADKVAAVEIGKSWGAAAITLKATGGEHEFTYAPPQFVDRFVEVARRQIEGAQHAAPAQSQGDPLAEVERLARLREAGHLSKAEFETLKGKLLASM